MVLADSSRWSSAAGVTLLYSFATVVGGIVIGHICGLGLLSRRWLTPHAHNHDHQPYRLLLNFPDTTRVFSTTLQ
jgi:heme A synthase